MNESPEMKGNPMHGTERGRPGPIPIDRIGTIVALVAFTLMWSVFHGCSGKGGVPEEGLAKSEQNQTTTGRTDLEGVRSGPLRQGDAAGSGR